MADYRDELRAAHERIAQLEARQPPPPKKDRTVLVVVGVVFAFVIVAGSGLVWVTSRWLGARPAPAEFSVPVDPFVAAPSLGMSWYPQPLVAPAFVDIDDAPDGKKEILGLAWRAGSDEAALHLVALDRDTLAVRWHAGPYPAHWNSDRVHLLVAKDRAVVTDSRNNLHVIDLRTGKESLPPTTFEGGAQYACPVLDGTARVLLNAGHDSDTTMVMDVGTRAITKAPKGLSCGLMNHRDRACVAGSTATPCELPADKSIDAKANARPGIKGFWSSEVLAANEDRVAIGYVNDGAKAGGMAFGFDAKTKKILWGSRLVPEGDSPDHRQMTGLAPLSILADGRLLFLYQSAEDAGPFRLVGRAGTTGELLYKVDVPGSAEGSFMSSLSVDGSEVFVIMNQTLHVFDAKTGAVKTSLGQF
jgi:hypothetical protein